MSVPQDASALPPTIVEARGVLCPVPIIRLARAARTLPTGSLVVLLTDDVAAEHDVPAWCTLRGHELLASTNLPEDGACGSGPPPGPEPHAPNPAPGQARRHLIRLGPAAPAGATPTGLAPAGPAS